MPRTRTTTTRARSRTRRIYKKASVGRFDGEYKQVAFQTGDTVQDLLDKANITSSSSDEINDDMGNTVKPTDAAKEQTYHVTGNYKNGC